MTLWLPIGQPTLLAPNNLTAANLAAATVGERGKGRARSIMSSKVIKVAQALPALRSDKVFNDLMAAVGQPTLFDLNNLMAARFAAATVGERGKGRARSIMSSKVIKVAQALPALRSNKPLNDLMAAVKQPTLLDLNDLMAAQWAADLKVPTTAARDLNRLLFTF